ncbi:MAG: hypothetical protein E7137_05350 [Rikenellaceae bacterium]|nr:hypothetical protein [Rikenellaceae bacterium]
MKKLISFLTASILWFGLSVSITSCDKDNEESTDSASLIGTWRHDFSSGYQLMTFNSNFHGSIYEVDYAAHNWSDSFTWKYTPASSDLVLFSDEEHEVETYKVILLTNDVLILQYYVYDEYGKDEDEPDTWYRVE